MDKWEDLRDTLEYGPSCSSVAGPNSPLANDGLESEDCLTINIWVPKIVQRTKENRLPVMVFLHGGAFILGSSSHPLTSPDPELFARENGVIYVSLNYRLGPLGFMAHPKLGSVANFGLYDQLAALKWVKQNIISFFGDSEKITISGSSAGAISICFLLTSPLAEGLFHRVIFQSTLCDFSFSNLTQAYEQSKNLSHAVGCDPFDLNCLRKVGAKSLGYALPLSRGVMWTEGVRWFPIIEGSAESIAPEIPIIKLTREGIKDKDIDVIVGFTRDEGSLFLTLSFPLYVPNHYLYQLMFNAFGEENWKGVMNHYQLDLDGDDLPDALSIFPGYGKISSLLLSHIWECSSYRLAEAIRRSGNRVHIYKFVHPPSYLRWPFSIFLGVPHGAEMNFVYKNKRVKLNLEESELSDDIVHIWGWFISHEEPWEDLKPIYKEDEILLHWPMYQPTVNGTLLLAPADLYQFEGEPRYCTIWDKVLKPDGVLLFPVAQGEPFISRFLNLHVAKLLRNVKFFGVIMIIIFLVIWIRNKKYKQKLE
eukprot:TRINITY_DN27371_c0_g1_i1.p1 TRINITY_DN27371_c0_g1~~TRINITY_DN27371_c0_g1_i1.p1  ORF type:complete len:535 (+),score=90.41 TRINITY_DN27371_c0_g1_i1:1716-3320(+)